ncbi:MAG TPA: chloride channel protein [Bryobacteraceae bacterium]|nr:chloride channel protein [Bryobacteraceae bacterium]
MLRWLEGLRRNETRISLLLSLIIGALVGLVVVAFILLTGRLAARMYPAGGSGWRRVLVPATGSLLTGYLLFRYFPFARGSGIPQTKFALFVADGVIHLRTVIGKFACCTMSLASGIALGREGPSVQVGAGIASVLARRLGLNREQVKSLVPVGCSAALAAAFNTPIAAVLFSLEEILGDLHAPVLGAVVLSSATSWMVLHLVLGDDPLFHVPAYHLVHPVEFAFYAALGVVGGFGSVLFVQLLLQLRKWFADLPKQTAWLQPVAGGLGVGLMGYFVPDVLGVGYNYVERVLNGNVVFQAVAMLAILKIVATALCYASGNAGGIFGPSLFIGAMLGAAVGSVAHFFLPGYTADPGAYALIGMGTAFAGIVRTPLTSVIMIFELTRDYTIIVPLMISNLIAFFISYQLQREPIYEALAHQDGVHLPKVEHRAAYGRIRVATVMRPPPQAFALSTTVKDAAAATAEGDLEAWPVAAGGKLLGMISLADLQLALLNGGEACELHDLGSFSDAVRADFPHLHPDHTLSLGLERMGAANVKVLPIVSRADVRNLLGVVTLDDILRGLGVAGKDRDQEAD